ncbi:EAL domain-containing protein [Pelagibacterium luteolum]|uniref:Diguanylate cyclase/phosphodiesterase with PAS/PAC sensor(S) n=1 Tax=Pelagibacterium luteolum TaxID=440168 RepID=A0A1G7WTG7_9HYPH|nr:EAL domain-containing protein [Pelagibacterium luteolum]SDG75237.1 diguanylate cyclase/phosphodiesterase with PAS/PAC sensor(s) [Pelagibacterium luteolum]
MREDRGAVDAPARYETKFDFIELAISRTDRAILISDAAGRPCYVNPAFVSLFGYDLPDFASEQPWSLLAGPLTDERLHARARQSTVAGRGFYDDLLLRTKCGDPVWVSAKIDPIFAADGSFSHLVAMLSDITSSKRLQVFQRDVLDALARDIPLPELMHFICLQVEALAPDTCCTVLRVDEDHRLRPLAAPSLPDHVSASVDGVEAGPRAGSCGTAVWRGEPVLVEDIATDPLWSDFKHLILPLGFTACWSHPMVLKDGRVVGTFAFYYTDGHGPSAWHQQLVDACLHLCTMAIERFEARAKIRRLAYYDALTGLPNRTLMRQRLEQTLRADPGQKRKIAFLCLDIDRFKDVNDAFGQPMGDLILEGVGQRLLEHASTADMVCRLNGDRFVIILDECDADRAAVAAQELVTRMQDPFELSGASIPLGASIGIALYPGDATNVDALFDHGEAALMDAKSSWRGGYHFFSPAINALNKDRLLLGAALREAIAAETLNLVFQPQIEWETGGLYGVEALARWSHPEYGPIAPDRFIPVAEQIGAIEALGAWALRTASAQLAQWRRDGHVIPAMSVNISAQHFRDAGFAQLVADVLAENALKPADLTIEITESLMLEETATVVGNIEALAEMGVTLSMDDFGTGYSSLSLIARLPVKELKVDRAFIDRLESDASAQAVATAVICIGQSLNMSVVAEGVETLGQRRFLEALGCHAQQGYFYSRPMAAADFEDWILNYSGGALRRRA